MDKQQLRIAWDNSLAGRNRTGTGMYASRLLEELSRRCDIQVKVFTGHNVSRNNHGLGAVAIRNLATLYWNNIVFPYRLATNHFDLLHSPAFVLPFYCPIPTVVTVHDLTFRFFPEHFNRRWLTYTESVLPVALRSAAAVICVSQHTKSDLERIYNTPPEKVHVIYHGVDHNTFNPCACFDRSFALRIGLNKPYVLHVGEFAPRKNIPGLLRAFAECRSRGRLSGMQLLLVGSTSESRALREVHDAIRSLQLHDIVVFAGHVPPEVLPGLYANADLLVMPSLYEGFGLPIVEAMASGVPVVTTNSSSMCEIAGDAAILVPPDDHLGLADALDQVLHEHALAAEMRRKGLVRAQQFTWQRTAEETVAVYQKVATGA